MTFNTLETYISPKIMLRLSNCDAANVRSNDQAPSLAYPNNVQRQMLRTLGGLVLSRLIYVRLKQDLPVITQMGTVLDGQNVTRS